MSFENVTFELAPIYKRKGIEFIQAKAIEIYPEGGGGFILAVDKIYLYLYQYNNDFYDSEIARNRESRI